MKNNKGFTLVELAVSFCLIASISIMLLQLVLTLKEVYVSGDIKTTLLNKQGIMVKKIYDDLNTKDINSVSSCGLSCLTFLYGDGTSVNLLVDPGNKTVTYGDYTLKLDNSSSFGQLSFSYDEPVVSQTDKDDSVLTIIIPIYSKLLEEDFGIHIVKKYNSGATTIQNKVDIASTKVTVSGVDTTVAYSLDIEESENDPQLAGIFVKLFEQKSGNYITSFDAFLKNTNTNVLSSLTSLEAFRTTVNLDKVLETQKAIINENSSLNDREKQQQLSIMNENFQDGYFSLLLDYSGSRSYIDLLTNYTWWYQTSNFAKKEKIRGVVLTSGDYNKYLIPSQYSGNSCPFGGIEYYADNNSWANGCDDSHYAIGLKSGSIVGPSGNASSVTLWAEAREYVCKYSLSDITINGTSIKSMTWADGTNICS